MLMICGEEVSGGWAKVGKWRLTQFQNQLEAVERPTPRERMGSGKISPTMTPGFLLVFICHILGLDLEDSYMLLGPM